MIDIMTMLGQQRILHQTPQELIQIIFNSKSIIQTVEIANRRTIEYYTNQRLGLDPSVIGSFFLLKVTGS